MTPLTLEDQLALSVALVNVRKAAPRAEALPAGQPVSEDPAGTRGGLAIMPKPAPCGSEIPAQLSPSSVNGFQDCSMRWYYRKMLALPETRGAALGLGTAVHEALIENFRQKIETREDLPTEGVRALFVMALIAQLDTILLTKDDSADDLKECGETMVRVYMDRAAPAVEPAAVEEHVEGVIGGVPVHGYIDVRDVHGRIIDIKTAGRKPNGMSVAHRLQVATYAMLHPEASGSATLSTLTKTKTVALHEETIDILPRDRRLTERMYSVTRDQMQAGIYAPNRSSFLCSRKFCSFWQRCEDEWGGEVAA
jgi:putative RecB family exonuclease